ARQGQFLGQPVLQRAEGPLGAAPSLGRVGGDMLDAELLEGPADLGQLGLGDGLAGFRRVEIVAPSVGIERTEQPVPLNHLTQARKLEAVPSSSTRKADKMPLVASS